MIPSYYGMPYPSRVKLVNVGYIAFLCRMAYRNIVHLHHGGVLNIQSGSTGVDFVNTQSRVLCFAKDLTLDELVDKVRQVMDVEESSVVRLEGRYDTGTGSRPFLHNDPPGRVFCLG